MNDLHRPDDWDEPVVIAPVDPPRRILVPFDGSHCSERALSWAAMVAAETRGEIIVVVAHQPPITMKGRGASYVDLQREALLTEARELAEESVALLRGRHVEARGIVIKGDAARAILDTADDEQVDLIVIGRLGLTAEIGGGGVMDRFRQLLFGGVAEKITRHAGVPVLVVS